MTNEEFSQGIDKLWGLTRAGALPRHERFLAVEALTDEYVAYTGQRPPTGQLDRLATLCLYEEVTDPTPWKSRNTEYNIHSERQQADYIRNEVGGGALMALAYDGKTHEEPRRRRRTRSEERYVDRIKSRSPNGDVTIYALEET